MPDYNKSKLESSEKQHMGLVYNKLESILSNAEREANEKRRVAKLRLSDDHHYQIAYGQWASCEKKYQRTKAWVESVYEKPYFAHIEATFSTNDKSENNQHYYLSDSESLDKSITIDDSHRLIPFKADLRFQLSNALFRCYHARNGKAEHFTGPEVHGVVYSCSVKPEFICDDRIRRKHLISATLLYPLISEQVDADELLAELLDENRNNPALRNIISTLQQQQFEIIEANINQSFVVQGCAGSGKSQCVFHRLFFLREELSNRGWEKVILITPNQLFKSYSAELVRRFRLDSIKNCSISEFYFQLLHTYDSRFKNRHYIIRLSEEYLPDKYLSEVYSLNTINKIDKEIKSALRRFVISGYSALGIETPKEPDPSVIVFLREQLNAAIDRDNHTEELLTNDEDYQELKIRLSDLSAQNDGTKHSIVKVKAEKEKLEIEIEELTLLISNWNSALNERDAFISKHSSTDISSLSTEDYLIILNSKCTQAEEKLKSYTKNNHPESLLKKKQEKYNESVSKLDTLQADYAKTKRKMKKCRKRMRKIIEQVEGEKPSRTLDKAKLKTTALNFSRIESSIFEQEVWKALSVIKQRYGVESVKIELNDDNRRRETRILYKADLLFYIKLYSILYPSMKMPEYNYFCIDEAQDLHRADYEILRSLFPKAVFNLFGDTAQALHEKCGIEKWELETGISTVYQLNKNYRNTAATVEFCNQRFGSRMQSIGKIKRGQEPQVLHKFNQIKEVLLEQDITVIVKDKECYDVLLGSVEGFQRCEYIDTNSKTTSEKTIACYSVFAAKGLEFSNVLVFGKNMTNNQKVVACTRAMNKLYYYDSF